MTAIQEKRSLLKLVAGTQVPADATDDPVWQLMREHTAARCKYSQAVRVEFASEGNVPDNQFNRLQAETSGATGRLMETGRKLLSTRPTSLFGVIAVLRYVAAQGDDDDPNDGASPTYLPEEVDGRFWSIAFFDTIASALITIHGR